MAKGARMTDAEHDHHRQPEQRRAAWGGQKASIGDLAMANQVPLPGTFVRRWVCCIAVAQYPPPRSTRQRHLSRKTPAIVDCVVWCLEAVADMWIDYAEADETEAISWANLVLAIFGTRECLGLQP
jgi:hypothetical protein